MGESVNVELVVWVIWTVYELFGSPKKQSQSWTPGNDVSETSSNVQILERQLSASFWGRFFYVGKKQCHKPLISIDASPIDGQIRDSLLLPS